MGFIYNTLWYSGRICWGYKGILLDESIKSSEDESKYEFISCENNPKYKIEECDPINSEIEDFIAIKSPMTIKRKL